MRRYFASCFALGLVALLALSSGCGQVTYIVQQYDGPVRDQDEVSILRLTPDDPAQIEIGRAHV